MLNVAEDPFPSRLVDLSLRTMDRLRGERLEALDQVLLEAESFGELSESGREAVVLNRFSVNQSGRLIEILPLQECVRVVGVDVSSRRIGRTRNGVVCAVRGTVVWKDEYAYQYARYGPFLFHFTDVPSGTLQERELRHPFTDLNSANSHSFLSKVQGFVERELQKYVCRRMRDSIIVLDGCLSDRNVALEALSLARGNNNRVVALAKQSEIYVGMKRATSLLDGMHKPCLLYLGDLVSRKFDASAMLGWMFIAKLAGDGLSFRLDVDKALSFTSAVNTVRQLIHNDTVTQGYPETSRMAHMLSIITPLEAVAVQRLLAEEYQLRMQRSPNTRRMLFGPFGRWVDS